ncbi:AIPR family protein [Aeromonas hydrophila]|uniref:AIPR family protein n=1 Tax=Aeromonas hydrophila TaxID=644 RepID=UPI00207CBD0C|nr:AIPR family protein [Aeromonas hydrophila]MCO4209095.1 AIPR family protein [Aeromonas hydrophila]
MHLILSNHVNELKDSFSYSDDTIESKLFEYFCNFCIVSKYYFGRFNPIDVTTDEDDASIDGVAIIVDGELIVTEGDAKEIFSSHKTNLQVDIIITQAKSGDAFVKKDITNFKVGIDDFLSFAPKLPNGKLNVTALEVLRLIFKNTKKIKNKRPDIKVFYCTGGVYNKEREIEACFNIIHKGIVDLDYFNDVSVTPLGRSELIKFYTSLTQKNEATLKTIDFFGMPKMPNIPQAYVALVEAKNLVDSLLSDEDGNIKHAIFEENVRSYLGGTNDVNKAIHATLNSAEQKQIFSVLNNGITVSAPELTFVPNTKEIHLTNYQIINGCQTSNTLFENRGLLDDTVQVVVKFIESPDNNAANEVIAATNSQTNIPTESFFGLKNKSKLIQQYFTSKNKELLPDNHIFFERRQSEYKDKDYQATRIFDVKEIARCYAAMFLGIPHTSFRYAKTIFSAHKDELFKESDHESYYYAACLCLYKYQALINGRKINANNYLKRRWHVLSVFNWICHNSMTVPEPNSKKADAYAKKTINMLTSPDKKYVDVFKKVQEIIDSVPAPTDDELKRQKYYLKLREASEKYLQKK